MPKVKRVIFQCSNIWKHQNTKCRQGKHSRCTRIRLLQETITHRDHTQDNYHNQSVLNAKLWLPFKPNQWTITLLTYSIPSVTLTGDIYVIHFSHNQTNTEQTSSFCNAPKQGLVLPKTVQKGVNLRWKCCYLRIQQYQDKSQGGKNTSPGIWDLFSNPGCVMNLLVNQEKSLGLSGL